MVAVRTSTTLLAVILVGHAFGYGPATRVTIEGQVFLINGRPTYEGLDPGARGRLMNVRMVNAVFEDGNPETCPEGFDPIANTSRFISSMDQYKSRGILAFTVNLQGGMPGYEGALNSAFLPDGSLKTSYMARVSRVIEAADARGLVIILGYFYQRQDQVLTDERAIRQGVISASGWLRERGYTNVLVEIANEYKHPGFDHEILTSESGEVELMDLVRSVAPNLLVSTSGMGDADFHPQLAAVADFILLHGNSWAPENYGERIARARTFGKPVLFNEDWCFSDDTRGIADAVIKLRAAFDHGASWGVMNQRRNQTYPFVFRIGDPAGEANAKEDYRLYEALARLLGITGR